MLFLLGVVLFLVLVMRVIKQVACQLYKVLLIHIVTFFSCDGGATLRRRVFPRYPLRALAR